MTRREFLTASSSLPQTIVGVGSARRIVFLNEVFDFYVDGLNGNDAGTGSVTDPWKTLTRLRTELEGSAGGSMITALVLPDAYVDQHLDISYANSGSMFEITFRAGCSITWTLGTDQSGIQIGSGTGNTLTIFGNGLSISGFTVGTGNGLGCNNSTLIAHMVDVSNCVDGISGHGTGQTFAYDCNFSACLKAAFAHVGTGNHYAERCTFNGLSGSILGIGSNDSSGSCTFLDCAFIPATAGQALKLFNSTLDDCQLGTTAVRVSGTNLFGGTGTILNDCYVNLSTDLRFRVVMTRCYGRVSFRVRGASTDPASEFYHCVFVGTSSGSTNGWIFGNFDDGSGNWDGTPYVIENMIVTGYVTAIGGGFSANQIAKFNANSSIDGVSTFGNATGIVAGITAVANQITADPLLGPANTTVQADYAVGPGSPCIGAGPGGTNIGFTAGDLA